MSAVSYEVLYNFKSNRQQLNNDANANYYKREFEADDQNGKEEREFEPTQNKRAFNEGNAYEDDANEEEK